MKVLAVLGLALCLLGLMGCRSSVSPTEEPRLIVPSTRTFSFTIEVDGSLPEHLGAPWLAYLMARAAYLDENRDQYSLSPGILIPKFEEEVAARKDLAQIWKELKERTQSNNDKYLDELLSVHDGGFMREYVWTYLRQPTWTKQPRDLELKEFGAWERLHLEHHTAESYGNIKVVKEIQSDLTS